MSVMTDYFVRGMDAFVLGDVNLLSASVKQLAQECYIHHQEEYGFDFVLENDDGLYGSVDDEEWFIDEITQMDSAQMDDVLEQLLEELGEYEADQDDLKLDNYEVPDEAYKDPVKLLEFLEGEI